MDENVGEAKRAAVFGMNSEDVSRRSSAFPPTYSYVKNIAKMQYFL